MGRDGGTRLARTIGEGQRIACGIFEALSRHNAIALLRIQPKSMQINGLWGFLDSTGVGRSLRPPLGDPPATQAGVHGHG